jgi:hypothetical protein
MHVIYRKVSLGTQSQTGERFAERAHSAATICGMQGARYSATSAT